MSTQGTPNTQPVKTKSKAYSSTVAIQGDAAKYRLKYKELKKKVREIESVSTLPYPRLLCCAVL